MRNKYTKDDFKQRLKDAMYEIERAMDELDEKYIDEEDISEAHDIDVSKIMQWFESPFVSEFDKQTAIKSYKREA
jgi:hypothetical protein